MIKTIIAFCFIAVAKCENDQYASIMAKLDTILTQNRDECIQKFKVEPSLVDQLLSDTHMPRNEDLQCYVECALSKTKFINEDFKLDNNVLKDVLPSESASVANEIVTKCENVGGGEKCEKVYDILRCIYYELKSKFNA
ncbi:hypothetical protein FQR65_LT07124 [Abscondita terminalis]|nr:hypothetical protein FQR65_LT07124 [Abscondita terminalis]